MSRPQIAQKQLHKQYRGHNKLSANDNLLIPVERGCWHYSIRIRSRSRNAIWVVFLGHYFPSADRNRTSSGNWRRRSVMSHAAAHRDQLLAHRQVSAWPQQREPIQRTRPE
jgi:hypothetical protein